MADLTFESFLCPIKSIRNMYLPSDSPVGLDSILLKFIFLDANSPSES